MAHAFAERELERRDAGDRIDLLTGGTDPADRVHDVVVEAMAEAGIDLSDRTPREITPEDLADVDVVVTMGCSAEGICPTTWRGDARDWDLADPHGRDPDDVRAIRDEIESRVRDLFDELLDGPLDESVADT
ncbi:MAG: low molecular weight phosphatase family protein [Haloferacaceae archaeon]